MYFFFSPVRNSEALSNICFNHVRTKRNTFSLSETFIFPRLISWLLFALNCLLINNSKHTRVVYKNVHQTKPRNWSKINSLKFHWEVTIKRTDRQSEVHIYNRVEENWENIFTEMLLYNIDAGFCEAGRKLPRFCAWKVAIKTWKRTLKDCCVLSVFV